MTATQSTSAATDYPIGAAPRTASTAIPTRRKDTMSSYRPTTTGGKMTTDEATSLLMQYSEWLDVEKINPSEPDPSTHADLVAAFLSQRTYQAIICRRRNSDLITIWSRPATPEQAAIDLQWCRDNKGDDFVFDLVSL